MDRYSLSIDIAHMETVAEYQIMLERLTALRLSLTSFIISGPAGGNHRLVLQGTADDLVRWLNEDYYDDEQNYTFPDACRIHDIVFVRRG